MKTANPVMKIAVIGLITLGAAVILAYYYVTAGGRLPFSGHLYTVTAQIQDSQGLLKHADVRAAGVKVGTVSNITNTVTPTGTIADVQMQLDGNYAPIYNDATVLIRQKTLVGENYVEVNRGHPQSGQLRDGAMLPLSHDVESVPLDKILNSLDPRIRSQIRVDMQALGTGLHHEGKHLNQFLGALQPTVHNGVVVLNILDGQRNQVADVISQTGTVMQALANRTADLRSLITGAQQTASAVAARDAALRQSLVELPSTLSQARASVAKLSGFSGNAEPVIANLRVAVENLRPVVRDLRPTATTARRLFDALPPFVRAANPLLGSLKKFSGAAAPAVPGIEALLRELNPVLAYMSPYSREISGALDNLGGIDMYETFDNEQLGRCLCPISIDSYTNYTPAERKLVDALIRAGGLGGIANPTTNPLRRPNLLPDASKPFTGSYPHITADPPASLKP
jgi:phospholipid/cholesterol/gamma-HCH transport system substrate-binding protein